MNVSCHVSRRVFLWLALSASALLAACGGGSSSGAVISGTLSGLVSGGSITLQNNLSESISVSANGTFEFTRKVGPSNAYYVTIPGQPNGQYCVVNNGNGAVNSNGDAVNGITVDCQIALGGTTTGLVAGNALVLSDGSTSITQFGSGNWTFAKALAAGTAYTVSIGTQPYGQVCAIPSPSGTIAASTLTNVAISCQISLAGTVTGLGSGLSLVLSDGTNSLTVSANGVWDFAKPLTTGTAYAVTVATQPTGQTCTITSGSGTIADGTLTRVVITCV